MKHLTASIALSIVVIAIAFTINWNLDINKIKTDETVYQGQMSIEGGTKARQEITESKMNYDTTKIAVNAISGISIIGLIVYGIKKKEEETYA